MSFGGTYSKGRLTLTNDVVFGLAIWVSDAGDPVRYDEPGRWVPLAGEPWSSWNWVRAAVDGDPVFPWKQALADGGK
jgi:hypothetical protein